MDLPIEVRFGLEVCYTPEAEPFLRDILSQYPYDFLVGSVHSVDGILYDMPFSRELLWDRYPADGIYRRYYELIEQLMRSGLFTQVAHPDTIKLFDIYPSYDLVPTYEKLAKLAVEQDLYMEDNTGCHYRYHTADIGLSDAFLRVLIDQQAKIMTASDAHVPEHVGNFIPEACERSGRWRLSAEPRLPFHMPETASATPDRDIRACGSPHPYPHAAKGGMGMQPGKQMSLRIREQPGQGDLPGKEELIQRAQQKFHVVRCAGADPHPFAIGMRRDVFTSVDLVHHRQPLAVRASDLLQRI